MTYEYIREGAEIYSRSFSIIRSEADLASIPEDLEPVAVRMIHASGQVDLVGDMAFSPGAGLAGRRALTRGATILTDSKMVADGVTRSRLPSANLVVCTLSDPATLDRAEAMSTTRSAAAVDGWADMLEGSVVAIGNAPTALYRLLELLDGGAPHPALIIGVPVGFVGAAESKEALITSPSGVPYVTVRGRRGGSAIAASAVNALAGQVE